MPLIRILKPAAQKIRCAISPTYRYQKKLEEYQFGEERHVLLRFLEKKNQEATEFRASRTFKRGQLLSARIRKDYFQFCGSFSEALHHRISYQESVRENWWTIFTPNGWRERRQIAIEWMKAPAVKLSNPDPFKFSILERAEKPFKQLRFRRGEPPFKGADSQKRFSSAVRGKRVLVLGPGLEQGINQEILNDFDVLAMPKLHSGFWIENLAVSERPIIVVTYLNHKIVTAMLSTCLHGQRVWDFARVKSIEDVRELESLYADQTDRQPVIGQLNSPDHLLMNTYGPFMGTAMIFDILSARPRNVFLMGFNFFAKEGKLYSNRYESASHPEEFLLNSLRVHGAFSNFLFLKNLYHFGLVQADEETSAILSLSASEYAKTLDSRFAVKHAPSRR